MIHATAIVQTDHIGDDTFIWQYTVVLKEAVIGRRCNINAHCFIENKVFIGDDVTIKSGNYIWDGAFIEDKVQIGPNVTLTNDKFPRAKNANFSPATNIFRRGSSIGGGAVILPGIEIGEYAMVGAGSVVTKDVPAHGLVVGNPGKLVGYVDELGNKLDESQEFVNKKNGDIISIDWSLIKK